MKGNKRLRGGRSRFRGVVGAVTGFLSRIVEIPHVGSILLGAFVAGILAAMAGQIFVLRRVVIEGPGAFPSDQVVSWSGLRGGENLLFLDLKDVVKRLEAQRWIADVRIWKVWPHTLRVRLDRKTPFALLSTSQGLVAVDEQGTVLGEVDKDSPGFRLDGLPLPQSRKLDDARWKEVVMLASRLQRGEGGAPSVRSVAVSPGRIEIQTQNHRLIFAAGRADDGWKTFERFRTAYGPEKMGEFSSFDLTIPDRVYTRPSPPPAGAAEPLTPRMGEMPREGRSPERLTSTQG